MKSHGHTRNRKPSPTYRAWVNMLTRCRNPKSTQYRRYGGRGITVCESWLTFDGFLADMGLKPSDEHSLERIDNEVGYIPSNCRWATKVDQCRNRCSSRAVVRSDGQQFPTLSEAAEAVGGTIGGIWDVCNGKAKTHRGFGWSYP